MNTRVLHYLATPIKSEFKETVQRRYRLNKMAVNILCKAGYFVYSPMLHYLDVKTDYMWPTDWSFWSEPSLGMIDRCDGMIVLLLPGWAESVGVMKEMEYARLNGKMIYAMNEPDENDGRLVHPSPLLVEMISDTPTMTFGRR